ncbi:LysR family transcriptional regulator [Bacillus sp. FJAT-42315]|uniref:LysR family transcriptional regulator n=1 Tax=Bacillus sp. FJAT-42315 TaxID=2014077 RepID=UPI0018E288EA|nr:LysR family transcriptional regulator [Bacillus sp. FJAT-42315]
MNIEQLEHIVEVAKYQSISRAAEILHITQSGLSLSITALEKELDLKIFYRSRAGAIPTDSGKEIIKKSVEALNKIRELKEEAYFQTHTITGDLSFEGIPGVMPTLVRAVAFLKKKYPSLNIEISEKGSFEIIENFKQNKVDMGFVALTQEMLQEKIGVDFEPIIKGKMVVCVGKKSSLSNRRKIHPQELINETFILYKDDYVDQFMEALTKSFGHPQILFTTNNSYAIEKALTEDVAITIGHDYSFVNHPLIISGELVTLEVMPYPQQEVYFGWLNKRNDQLALLSKQIIQLFKQDLTRGEAIDRSSDTF